MELRDLPAVDALADDLREASPSLPPSVLVSVARDAVEEARSQIASGAEADPSALAQHRIAALMRVRPTRVINATGVLLHTNLGRAPLATAAAKAAHEHALAYSNLEYDLETGMRGGRGVYVSQLLTTLTGAEDAIVVNNNAAALSLALAALGGEGGVAVSRGELIEIGGSFRLPDVMEASGARLVEVGTTNRTRLADYERVINDVALVLKVHPSNYRVEGFAETVTYEELATLAHQYQRPIVADLGSGLLDSRLPWLANDPPSWLREEPAVRQTLADGVDLALFSGDKLLGGPQAGIGVGVAALVQRMAAHPVARAVRSDGITLAALAATLELYASDRAIEIPFWHMAMLSYESLAARHQRVLAEGGGRGEVIEGESLPGAGSVPGETIPSPNLRLSSPSDATWARLVSYEPAVVARRREGAVLIDLRTVEPADDEAVAAALRTLN